MVKAELLSIGDELLIGQTINTNAAWLGEHLNLLGIEVVRTTVVSDTRQGILQGIDEAAQRADIVIMTGGLGPTRDDITKHTLCEYFNTKLVRDPEILQRIEAFFTSRGREMLEVNRQQADLPEACTIIRNHNGTASGMWFERNGRVFISMPGVPYETKAMMTETAFPMLQKHFNLSRIVHRTIMTQGIGESFLADQIKDWEDRIYAAGMSLAYLPSPGMVKLRITAREQERPETLMEALASELEQRFPQYVYGANNILLEEVIGRMLKERGKTLATAESCTGGYLAHRITSVSGSSQYYLGSVVAYSNALKTQLLGVSENHLMQHGAVSEAVVSQMASGARKALGVDYAIATSGVAGPDGGSEEKPVGTIWVAVASADGVRARRFLFGNNRERNIIQAALSGMNMLRLAMAGIGQ
jgi:nicotinamide-nucleotide amidase